MLQIHRLSFSFYIFLILLCALYSCDSYVEGSVLYNIMRKLKFRVTLISEQIPSRLKNYDVLFLQELTKLPTENEIKDIQNFVKKGGSLIVSGGYHKMMEIFADVYGLKLKSLSNRLDDAYRNEDEPFFPLNAVNRIQPRAYFTLQNNQRDMANLYGAGNQAVVATLKDGDGRVYLTTSDYLFNENGLRHNENARLFYNIMSTFPTRARIGLAEGNYYTINKNRDNTFISFVFKTSWGLAAVYICLILFVFMTLRGRRFGEPLNIREKNRRLSSEYVHAMTALYQKGNTRKDILRHIQEKFRSDLGRRWRVNPNLDTSAFMEELTLRGLVDKDTELTNLIRDLEPVGDISETQLIEIAKRVETYRANTNMR